jgi:DNA-3-methyladenine glycosylase
MDLSGAELFLEGAPPPRERVVVTARIGVEAAGLPWARRRWRFAVAGSRWVSGPRRPP